jgi:hypothetical protein
MRSSFALLARHFFGRLFDNDIVSQTGDMRTNVVQALGLVAAPGILVPFFMLPQPLRFDQPFAYNWLLVIDCYFFVLYSIVVMGLVVVLEWDALFPDRADYLILTPLPLSGSAVFAGKISSLVAFLGLFVIDGNLFGTLLVPVIAGGHSGSAVLLAHITAVAAGGAFMVLAFAGLQGVLLNVLTGRAFRRISPWVQMAAMGAVITVVVLTPLISALIRPLVERRSPFLQWFPPFWFLGLYLDMLPGRPGGPVFHELALRARQALGIAAAVFAVTYAVGYRRHARRIMESIETAGEGPGRLRIALDRLLNRWLLRQPLERATFHFISNTILRTARHRLFLAAIAGVTFALAAMSVVRIGVKSGAALASFRPASLGAVALTFSFFTITGLRAAFNLPAELRANWIFQVAESGEPAAPVRAVRKWIVIMGVVPLFSLLVPVEAAFEGWRVAVVHLSFAGLLGMLLLNLLLIWFRKIPFTCSYFPAKMNMAVMFGVYMGAFTTYCWTMADLEEKLMRRPAELLIFYATAIAALRATVWLERRERDGYDVLIYEDQPDPIVRTLGLG